MRVLVNALATTNMSGRHVLLGFLGRLAEWTQGDHDFVVLYNQESHALCADLGDNVAWRPVRLPASAWWWRALWETVMLPRLVREVSADLLFHASGMIALRSPVPQVSLAMNPWCLVRDMQTRWQERFKAAMQRRAYRDAVERADLMVYLSAYLREAYHINAGQESRRCVVAYSGLGDDIMTTARPPLPLSQRDTHRIVSASAMAPHKGVDVLLRAVHNLRQRLPSVTLDLVGPWPDRDYEQAMRRLCSELSISDAVRFLGYMERSALLDAYSTARVFCLMSRCESFGIPGLEAQAMGTPVVCSNCCAMPEVYGSGGAYSEQNDVSETAGTLARLLTDDAVWRQYSNAAISNVRGFDFETTTKPLMEMFKL